MNSQWEEILGVLRQQTGSGILGDDYGAVLGEDWMAAFLKEMLPHVRMLLDDQRLVPAQIHVTALEALLQQYKLRYESRLESLASAVDQMDAETDRLRAAILEKVYAWQAFPAGERREVVDELRLLAIEWGPPGADSSVVMAAIKVLSDNLPEKEP